MNSMNRDIEGLRNHLFAQLEKLGNEDLDGDELKQEIERSKSISQLSASLIETAKAEFKYMELTDQKDRATGFIDSGQRRLK